MRVIVGGYDKIHRGLFCGSFFDVLTFRVSEWYIFAMPDCFVSVIIPVYNASLYLSRCLESLCKQTYPYLEIVCVNDGSTDDSGAILDDCAARDSRVKVIHQTNAGVSAARNAGLNAATGELVAFVDADDWMESDAYEKVVRAMTGDVDVICIGSSVDGELPPGYRSALEYHLKMERCGPVRLNAKIRANMGGEIWNKIFRRKHIEKYGLRFPVGLSYGEDKVFTCSYAFIAQKAYFIEEPLYHYQQHAQSAMAHYAEQKNQDIMARHVFDVVFEFAKLHTVSRSRSQKVLALLYGEYMECALRGADNETRRTMFREGSSLRLLGDCCAPSILALRHEFRSSWERLFHGYIHNREYFGLGRLKIWSITYELTRRVHRFLGFYMFAISNK